MTFTLENLKKSVARILKGKYPYPVYGSPNQQATELPCWFVFFLPSNTEKEVGGFQKIEIGVDIKLLQRPNSCNAYELAEEAALCLDEAFGTFLYSDGEASCLLSGLEREWKIENEILHYQFHIQQRVSLGKQRERIQKLEGIHGGIKDGEEKKNQVPDRGIASE